MDEGSMTADEHRNFFHAWADQVTRQQTARLVAAFGGTVDERARLVLARIARNFGPDDIDVLVRLAAEKTGTPVPPAIGEGPTR